MILPFLTVPVPLNLPKGVLEAASIDGMNGWQRMRFITIPLMEPAFVITIFLTLRNCFMVSTSIMD